MRGTFKKQFLRSLLNHPSYPRPLITCSYLLFVFPSYEFLALSSTVPAYTHAFAQNVIQSFDSRQDLLNPTKRPAKGLEKAIILAKAERGSMAEVSYLPVSVTASVLPPSCLRSRFYPNQMSAGPFPRLHIIASVGHHRLIDLFLSGAPANAESGNIDIPEGTSAAESG